MNEGIALESDSRDKNAPNSQDKPFLIVRDPGNQIQWIRT